MSSRCPPVETLVYCRKSSGLNQYRPLQEVISTELCRKSSGLNQYRPLQEVIGKSSGLNQYRPLQEVISTELCRKSSGLNQYRPLQKSSGLNQYRPLQEVIRSESVQTSAGSHQEEEPKFPTVVPARDFDPGRDATRIDTAIKTKGPGTDEETLIEMVCSRNNEELLEIKRVYREMFKKELDKEVAGDTSGDFAKLLLALVQTKRDEPSNVVDYEKIDEDARCLYEAGVQRKAPTWPPGSPSCPRGASPTCRKRYKSYSPYDMKESIRKEVKGDLEKSFLTLVECFENRQLYFANRLNEAMKSKGAKEKVVTRIMVSRCEIDLMKIRSEFRKTHKRTLYQTIAITSISLSSFNPVCDREEGAVRHHNRSTRNLQRTFEPANLQDGTTDPKLLFILSVLTYSKVSIISSRVSVHLCIHHVFDSIRIHHERPDPPGPGPSCVSMKSETLCLDLLRLKMESMMIFQSKNLKQKVHQQRSEGPGGQSAQQLQTDLDSIFMVNELKKIQTVLTSDYPECLESQREDEEVLDGEDEEQRRSSRGHF
ncbi:hypothetical protein F7725_025752 [Dissostichus mawsoni]|uniref:Annexin n=1 Tax=Dissostichus mawsoni TaxID=36200 RepID=A0A7J5X5X1_DISMA|nr:hypothetical protein F7725_025752 [Dissostichus mawsoni]